MPGGRPTDYRPEFCEGIIEYCKDGATFIQYAAEIGVVDDTLREWCRKHPEFSVAYARAKVLQQAAWEKRCFDNLDNRNFNSRLAEFIMSARFNDYRPPAQRQELHITGNVNVRSLPRAELERLAAQVVDIEEVKSLPELAQESQTPDTDTDTET